MLRYREAQVRALEEMEEKHQAMSEEAQQEKEQEKKLLMTVCVHIRNTLDGAAVESLTVFKPHHRTFINAWMQWKLIWVLQKFHNKIPAYFNSSVLRGN